LLNSFFKQCLHKAIDIKKKDFTKRKGCFTLVQVRQN
jgi:hypothetical protein